MSDGGEDIALAVDSGCVHSDGLFHAGVRAVLTSAGRLDISCISKIMETEVPETAGAYRCRSFMLAGHRSQIVPRQKQLSSRPFF